MVREGSFFVINGQLKGKLSDPVEITKAGHRGQCLPTTLHFVPPLLSNCLGFILTFDRVQSPKDPPGQQVLRQGESPSIWASPKRLPLDFLGVAGLRQEERGFHTRQPWDRGKGEHFKPGFEGGGGHQKAPQ